MKPRPQPRPKAGYAVLRALGKVATWHFALHGAAVPLSLVKHRSQALVGIEKAGLFGAPNDDRNFSTGL